MSVILLDSPFGYHILYTEDEKELDPSLIKNMKLICSYKFPNAELGVVINQKIENKNILPDQISTFIADSLKQYSFLPMANWYFTSDSLMNLILQNFHAKCHYLPPIFIRAINENIYSLLNTTEAEYDKARMALVSVLYDEETYEFESYQEPINREK